MENIIEINNLSKSFKDVKAVSNLSIKVKRGQFYAFLGLNGAGKSTTISIMCGQLEKDDGKVIIDGVNLDENNIDMIKRKLGVVFQFSVLDKTLSVKDNLYSRGALYGLSEKEVDCKIASLDEMLNLSPLLKRTFGKLSGGEKRRVDLARALINSPKILILDEPTTGLDPKTRKDVWTCINKQRVDNDLTVFLTTHYMEETTDADYVVILDNGKIVGEGTPNQLKDRFASDYILLYETTEEVVKSFNYPYVKIVDGFKISLPKTEVATKLIVDNPSVFNNFEVVKGTMDDVFLAVTGKRLKEDKQ